MFRVISLGKRSLVRFSVAPSSRAAHHGAHDHHAPAVYNRVDFYPRIGAREVVGYGRNGEPMYIDSPDMPCPSVRWREDTDEVKKLREKAKGDWSTLSIAEKKALYRADFRQTIAENTAPTGEWKFTFGWIVGLMGAAIWFYYFFSNQVYNYPGLPTSSMEHQTRVLERMIGMGVGRVHGVSSEWDYEKGDWKKNTGAK